MYVCIYTYTSEYICICVYTYKHIHMYTYIHIERVCIYIYIYTHREREREDYNENVCRCNLKLWRAMQVWGVLLLGAHTSCFLRETQDITIPWNYSQRPQNLWSKVWFLELDGAVLVPQPHHLLAVRPCARYLTSMCLSCLICAKGIIRVPKAAGCCEKCMIQCVYNIPY